MSYTLTTSAAILYKTGENNPMLGNASSAAILAKFSDEAEGVINSLTKFDWVTNYSSIGTNYKPMLDEAAASYAAKLVIIFNTSKYTSRVEPQTMLDVLEDNFNRCIQALNQAEVKRVMGAT